MIHVAGAGLGRGELRQSGELVDQRAQSTDAAENHLAALADDAGRIGLAAIEMPANAFGAEGDGRERILDFVGHLLRHFLPGELALRAQELSGVFDYEDTIRPARDRVRDGRW